MARLPYLEQSDLPPEHQDLLKRNITLYKQLAHSPKMLRAFQTVGYHIRFGSPMETRLRELAILQVGWLAKSPYEWSHHVKLGLDFGVSEADIHALIDDTAGKPTNLDEVSKLVLKGAREMTTDGEMTAETFAACQAAFGNEQAVDLTITIAFYNAVVRVLGTLKIDVEPEYQPYLDRFPLPA